MDASSFKQKEINRLNDQIALGRLSLIPARDAAVAELYALRLQENGSNVKLLNPDVIPGVLQQETATVVGTVTISGNVNVTITSAYIDSGTPKTIAVAVLEEDEAVDVAEKIRTELAEDADVVEEFTVSGEDDKVVLTARNYYGDDDTLNIGIAVDDAVGITTAATSEDTTVGLGSKKSLPVTVGNIFCSGDEEGFEVTLPSAALTTGQKVFIKKTDAGAGEIVIKCHEDETIEGVATVTLTARYDFIFIISGGDGWYYINSDVTA